MMFIVHPEYVINDHQETKAVLLPFHEWQQVLEALEELDDIRAYDDVKAHALHFVPFEQAVQEIREGNIA